MFNVLKISLLAFLACCAIACSVSPQSESTGEFIDSTTTTAKVKAALVDHLGTKGLSIQVKTFKDEVQLSGFVNSQATKRHAGAIAGDSPGVKRVINDIIVK